MNIKRILGSRNSKTSIHDTEKMTELQSLLIWMVSLCKDSIELRNEAITFLAKNSKFQLEKLPYIFLRFESILFENCTSLGYKDKLAFRKAVSKKYPSLLEVSRFKLIFLSHEEQEIMLCRIFLAILIGKLSSIFNRTELQLVAKVQLNLQNPYKINAPNEEREFAKSELVMLAHVLFEKYKEKVGAEKLLKIYEECYHKSVGDFYLLDASTVILEVIPIHNTLNNDTKSIRNYQLHSMLLKQLQKTDDTNQQLSKALSEVTKTKSNLNDKDKLYKTILDTSLDAFVQVDSELRIVEWNEKAYETFGWTKAEVTGKSLLNFVSDELSSGIQYNIKQFLKTKDKGHLNKRREVKTITKDKGDIDIEITVNPVSTPKGYLYAGFANDITQRVKDRKELIRAKELAEASSVAKSNFLSNISHEFRTPLNAILGLTEMLMDERQNKDVVNNLSGVQTAAKDLLGLIDNVLTYSGMEKSITAISEHKFHMRNAIMALTETFENDANKKGISFGLSISEDIPAQVMGDEKKITQILENLLCNAIKFTEQGGVKLEVGLSSQRNSKAMLTFKVSDTGIGIPEDKIVSIYDDFYQVHAPGANKYDGSGIGLSITKKLIELHGGTLDVVSELGIGTTFSFDLKLEVAEESGTKEATGYPILDNELPLKGLDVLTVEDDKINQRIIKKLLQGWGANVTLAENGLEGYSKSITDSFDLILMDLHMPLMDGFEAIEKIREKDGKTPIIACSADIFEDSRKLAFGKGVCSYTTKPIDKEDLKKVVLSTLANDVLASDKIKSAS